MPPECSEASPRSPEPWNLARRVESQTDGERRLQRRHQLWQAMARMPYPASHRKFAVAIGSGASTSRYSQPARPPGRLELGQLPGRAAFGRAAIDHYRRAVRPAGEGVRRVPPRPYHPAPSTTARTAERRSPSRPGPSPAISSDRAPAMTHTRRDRRPWTTTTGPADAAALSGRQTAAPG